MECPYQTLGDKFSPPSYERLRISHIYVRNPGDFGCSCSRSCPWPER